jgi:Domain of unknown function (DUF4328)
MPLRWVAEPPASTRREEPLPRRAAYTGPPRYRNPPRWGFPALPWTSPPDHDAPAPQPLWAARSLAATVVPLLWATAAVAVVAAGAEAWRYALLLTSRDGALSADAVAASDALVTSAGTIAPVLALLAGALVVLWSLRAAQAAADQAGVRPSRSWRTVAAGWVLPGPNLTVPGAVLAEIEHTALGRPANRRPWPSRLLLVWWALWVTGIGLAVVVLLWSLREGVQARADGVVLHGVADALAAVTAGVTAVVVTRLTRLLGPAVARRRELVVRVGKKPADLISEVRPPTAPAAPAS